MVLGFRATGQAAAFTVFFMVNGLNSLKCHCFQGQALAQLNIGNVLDCDGDWMGALNAFEESYR